MTVYFMLNLMTYSKLLERGDVEQARIFRSIIANGMHIFSVGREEEKKINRLSDCFMRLLRWQMKKNEDTSPAEIVFYLIQLTLWSTSGGAAESLTNVDPNAIIGDDKLLDLPRLLSEMCQNALLSFSPMISLEPFRESGRISDIAVNLDAFISNN
jgi:hypothetical protein